MSDEKPCLTISQRALALRELQKHDITPLSLGYLNQCLREARVKFPETENLLGALELQVKRVRNILWQQDTRPEPFEVMTTILALLVMGVRLLEEGDPAFKYGGKFKSPHNSTELDELAKLVPRDDAI